MSNSNFGLLKKLSVMAVASIPFLMNAAEDKTASGDLFYLDFTKNSATATLAVGSPECKAGKAVFIKDGDKYCLNAGDKSFEKLKYSTEGNINLQEGTLQIKYKPSFSKDSPGKLNIYRIFLLAEKTDSDHFSIGLNSSEDGKRNLWVFLKNKETEGKDLGIYQNVNMAKDVWYDISVTWNKHSLNLYLDKKLLGTIPMKGKLPEASSFYVGGSFYPHEGLIEYLKISPKAPASKENESINISADNWDITCKNGATGEGKIVNSPRRNSSNSYCIVKGNGLGWVQLQTVKPIKVKGGEKYYFRGWFHSTDSDLNSLLLFRITENKEAIPSYGEIDSSAGLSSQSFLVNSRAGEWKQRIISFAPKKDMEIYLNVILYGNPAKVYLADMELDIKSKVDQRENRIVKIDRRDQFKFSKEAVYQVLSKRKDATASIKNIGGNPALYVNQKPVIPVIYKAEPYRDNFPANRYEEFAAAGVPLLVRAVILSSTNNAKGIVRGHRQYDWDSLENDMMLALRRNPDANLIVSFNTYEPWPNWGNENPEECWQDSTGKRAYAAWGDIEGFADNIDTLNKSPRKVWWYPSYSSKKWQNDMNEVLKDVVEHLMASPLGKAVAGFQIDGGHDGQFQYPICPDYSKEAQNSFRNWLQKEYKDINSLNNACKTNYKSFSEISIPVFKEIINQNPLYTEGIEQAYTKFKFAESWHLRETFAKTIKQAAGKDVIFSCYGLPTDYICENLESYPHIDISVAVAWYPYRRGAYPLGANPESTYKLYNKLWLHELDMRSWNYPIQSGLVYDAWLGTAGNISEWHNTERKMVGVALAKRYGWWYYSMWRYFDYPEIMRAIGDTVKVAEKIASLPENPFRPDVCVIRAGFNSKIPYLNLASNSNGMPLFEFMMETSGVPYDTYYLNDVLTHKNLQDYKVYIFHHNTFISTQDAEKINRLLKNNNRTIVWLYSTGYVSELKTSTENMTRLTGMEIATSEKISPPPTPLAVYESSAAENTGIAHNITSLFSNRHENPLMKDVPEYLGGGNIYAMIASLTGKCPWFSPVKEFWVEDDKAIVLGKYAETGKTAMAIKRFPGWTSVYSALPAALPGKLINNIAKDAGAFRCGDAGQSIFMNGNFMSIHALRSGKYTFNLPAGVKSVIDPDSGKVLAENVDTYTAEIEAGKTYWFLMK